MELNDLDNYAVCNPDDAFKIWGSNLEKYYSSDGVVDVVIPDGVNIICAGAFKDCKELRSVVIPDGVEYIHQEAFMGCVRLERIVLPETLRRIDDSAFARCRSLKSIVLPDSVCKVEASVFSECDSLTEIKLSDGMTAIERSFFRGCYNLDNVVLPDSIERIDDGAFCGCRSLKSIVMSDFVSSIGNYVFQGCTSLESIQLSKNINAISSDTFKNCVSLWDVDVPPFVRILSDSAFEGCTALKWISLPDGLRKISASCFAGCTALQQLDIPESVIEIGAESFNECMCEIVIHDKIAKISELAFKGFKGSKRVELPPEYETDNVFAEQAKRGFNYRYLKDGTIEIVDYIGDELDVSVPRYIDGVKVTRIAEYAFSPVSTPIFNHQGILYGGKITSVKLPNSIYEIGDHAFLECSNLKKINIPQSVNIIGRSVFVCCYALEEIVFPDNIQELNSMMFDNCTALKRVCLPKNLTFIAEDVFVYCSALKSLYLPALLNTIDASAFDYCKLTEIHVHPDNPYFTVQEGLLCSKDRRTLVRCPEAFAAEEIIVPVGIESVQESAFAGCDNIIKVSLPDTVSFIGTSAFESCSSLKCILLGSKPYYEFNSFDAQLDFYVVCSKVKIDRWVDNEDKTLILKLVTGYLICRRDGFAYPPDIDQSYDKFISENYMALLKVAEYSKEFLRMLMNYRYINNADIPAILTLISDTEFAAELLQYSKNVFGNDDGIGGKNYKLE